jgi:hypothetical protein
MWDARFESIRDRKLNEMVIFAAMIRTDMPRRQEYMGIIDRLNRDLDVIEALAENRKVPESEPISSELYRSRLSKMELLDEYVLDACRSEDHVVPETIICKEAESTALEVSRPKELEPTVIVASPPGADSDKDSKALEVSRPKELEPTVIVTPAPGKSKGKSKGKTKSRNEDGGGIYDLVLTIDDAVTLKRVREMKDSKIDLFIDRELNGHFDQDACEDIIRFLKDDIRLIDIILSIRVSSKEDIEHKLRECVDFVDSLEEPKHKKMYTNALNREEFALEIQYIRALHNLEAVIRNRYPYLVEDRRSRSRPGYAGYAHLGLSHILIVACDGFDYVTAVADRQPQDQLLRP